MLSDYSSLLSHAVLRQRTRAAEHSAQVEAQLARRIKSEFIANMSHELRTPLNSVIGFAKLLGEHPKRRFKDAEIAEYADIIRDAATQLLTVINDILDISKMQSGRCTLDAHVIELHEVLQAALSSYERPASEARIALQSSFAPGLPPVRGDAAKLQQVFGNVIANAVKFTPPGGVVTIETWALPSGEAAALVRDTGVGMTDDEISVALMPFAQVDAGHSRWREGAGLGLPIAKALVQLHGGRLEIRSAKGQGTEVSVFLPAHSTTSVPQGYSSPFGADPVAA